MNILKSQRVVLGLALLAVTRLCFHLSMDYLFRLREFMDALMVVLPIVIGLGLSMHLLLSDFLTAKTWQAGLACAGGLYLAWTDLYLFYRFVRVVTIEMLELAIGFGVEGAMFFVFALMGLMTAAAFGWVLWIKRNVWVSLRTTRLKEKTNG